MRSLLVCMNEQASETLAMRVGCLAGCLAGSLVGRLALWLSGSLAHWLAGWLLVIAKRERVHTYSPRSASSAA